MLSCLFVVASDRNATSSAYQQPPRRVPVYTSARLLNGNAAFGRIGEQVEMLGSHMMDGGF